MTESARNALGWLFAAAGFIMLGLAAGQMAENSARAAYVIDLPPAPIQGLRGRNAG